jgi:hypothetical protein
LRCNRYFRLWPKRPLQIKKKDKTYDSFLDKLYSEVLVIRGKLLVFSFILLGAFFFGPKVLDQYISNSIPNSFEFHSNTEYDSVFVQVCGLQTKLFNHEELDLFHSAYIHSGNVVTHASGFPCKTEFTGFKNGAKSSYLAPPFDCNHCAVAGHYYKLIDNEVYYSLNY